MGGFGGFGRRRDAFEIIVIIIILLLFFGFEHNT